MERNTANASRFDGTNHAGHYESWFLRGNEPGGRRAFWIRYTIFQPKGSPESAVGERWAIVFSPHGITAVKDIVPLAECRFARDGLDVVVGDAHLNDDGAVGQCSGDGRTLRWDLRFEGDAPPLLLLPESLYAGGFPKAKALVPRPFVTFRGHIDTGRESIDVGGWRGSQNHNWGVRHTDRYAWGQVASFQERDDAFLEVSTAQVDLGPLRTPWLTPLVLRLGTQEHALNALWRTVVNDGFYGADAHTVPEGDLRWTFAATGASVSVHGTLEAPATSFVALPYGNPPGGTKYCLNTKIARCRLEVRSGSTVTRLSSRSAAFEVLCDVAPAGIPLAFLGDERASPRR